MTIAEIYNGAERFLNEIIRKEMVAQGHHLTGAMEDSLDSKTSNRGRADIMEGFAVEYTKFVNDGVPAESASMKQFPFLYEYFIKRGLGQKEAAGAAAATIKTWQKEGMSTQASKRFSSTGSRQHMIENALTGAEPTLDQFMSNTLDFAVDELLSKEKNEVI